MINSLALFEKKQFEMLNDRKIFKPIKSRGCLEPLELVPLSLKGLEEFFKQDLKIECLPPRSTLSWKHVVNNNLFYKVSIDNEDQDLYTSFLRFGMKKSNRENFFSEIVLFSVNMCGKNGCYCTPRNFTEKTEDKSFPVYNIKFNNCIEQDTCMVTVSVKVNKMFLVKDHPLNPTDRDYICIWASDIVIEVANRKGSKMGKVAVVPATGLWGCVNELGVTLNNLVIEVNRVERETEYVPAKKA